MEHKADIGVFGGSGFYNFLEGVQEVWVETPYGAPSDKIALARIGDKRVAFLPRHGRDHRYPPHMINYRANAWAMKSLGCTRVIGPCAAGSLQPHVAPGHFVVSSQFVDRTSGRKDTFYDGPETTHITTADPYCPELRQIAVHEGRKLGITVHDGGTVVVIQGPRFSTRSESKWFSAAGWEVINMTQYPEVVLCKELDMCYTNIALITDYDVGLAGDPNVEPVTHEAVIKVFNENNDKLRNLLFKMIEATPAGREHCTCGSTMSMGRFHG